MAITGRTATIAQSSSATSITGTLPTDRVTGDCVVAVFGMSTTVANFTAPSGWTQLVAPTVVSTDRMIAAYYRFDPPGAPVGTTAGAAARQTCICQAYGGVDSTTPADVAASIASNGTAPPATPSITTVTNGARLISGIVADSSGAPFTVPSGMTQLQQSTASSGRATAVADETKTTAGATGTRTWSSTASSLGHISFLAALRPSSSVDGTPAVALANGTAQGATVDANTFATPGPASSAGSATAGGGVGVGSITVLTGAGAANSTGAANTASTVVVVNATVTPDAASSTGAVPASGASGTAQTSIATAASSAPSADTVTAVLAVATAANATGAAPASTAVVSMSQTVTPAAAGTTADAPDAAVSVSSPGLAAADTAAGSATAEDVTVAAASEAVASAAAGTGSAADAVLDTSVRPAAAAATGQANNATITTVISTTAIAQAANATGIVDFDPAIAASFVLTADDSVTAFGAAYDPTIAISGSITTVTATTATSWVTANGAQVDGVDGTPDGGVSPITDTTHVSGSAFSARWLVTLRPATATAFGRANAPTVMGLDRPHKPHTGTPRVIPGVVIGVPVERRTARAVAAVASVGAHAGEPALV